MTTLYQIGEDGGRAGRWEINEAPVVVGRSSRAHVRIQDEGVSRRHFLIERDGEHYVIKDLNSRNGTWVGGCRVFAEKLHHNDCILAGCTRFLFAAPSARPTPPVKPLMGPHGTVIICAASGQEGGSCETDKNLALGAPGCTWRCAG